MDIKRNYNNKYELIFFLSQNSMSNHFIAVCKSPDDGKWYFYNDAIVTSRDHPSYQSNRNLDEIPCVLYYQTIKHKKNSDEITLFFNNGESKQLFLVVDRNMKAKDMIKSSNSHFFIIYFINYSIIILNK